jgi:HSP20 family protein
MAEQQTAQPANGNKAVATVEQRPMSLFERMEREMEDMRRQMFGLFQRPLATNYRPLTTLDTAWAPAADAYEQNGTFVVKAELPGVKKDDVHITLDGGLLTIEGRREEEKETKDTRFHTSERFAGSFSRSFVLPENVDAGKITAEFKDGVLEVRVPLPAEAKPQAVTIPVKG